MGMFAIGDLHLHFQTDLKTKLQMKERVWHNHEEVFRKNCETLLQPEDTLILTGDNSFGKNLSECEPDDHGGKYCLKHIPGKHYQTCFCAENPEGIGSSGITAVKFI